MGWRCVTLAGVFLLMVGLIGCDSQDATTTAGDDDDDEPELVTGPYVDKEGTPMIEGGGTLILESYPNWKGPGHNSVLQDEDGTFLVYHAYAVQANGDPFLRISPLEWENGWPHVPTTEEG